jgi:hypothetical protein
LKPESADNLELLGVEANGLSIFEVFFHHLRVLRFQLLIVEELEEREDDFSEDFIQLGQESFGKDIVGVSHCGLGSFGHCHVDDFDSSNLGIEVFGPGVTGLPEKSPYFSADAPASSPAPIPKGFHQLRVGLSCAAAKCIGMNRKLMRIINVVFIGYFCARIAANSITISPPSLRVMSNGFTAVQSVFRAAPRI